MNHPRNGVPFPTAQHSNHPHYTDQVQVWLDEYLDDIDDWTPEQLAEEILEKQTEWKLFLSNSTEHINTLLLP